MKMKYEEIEERFDNVVADLLESGCDQICRWPHEVPDQEVLWETKCECCPLIIKSAEMKALFMVAQKRKGE